MSDTAIQSGALVRLIRGGLKTPLAHTAVAGVVVGVFSILFYVSYAALIFSGPLAPWLAYGLTATFVTGAIGGAVTSWRSSLSFAIGGPDGSTCAVIAALVSTLAVRLRSNGLDDGLLTATLVVLALSAALTGLLLCGLGLARLGRAIRFVPYPVIGGFLGASGCLMLTGVYRILTGYPLSVANIAHLFDVASAEKLAAGIAVAAFLVAGRQYWKSPLAMPAQLLVSIAGFYIVLLMFADSHCRCPGPALDVHDAVGTSLCAAVDADICASAVVGIARTQRGFYRRHVRGHDQHLAQYHLD